jgi:hypothetical protein
VEEMNAMYSKPEIKLVAGSKLLDITNEIENILTTCFCDPPCQDTTEN